MASKKETTSKKTTSKKKTTPKKQATQTKEVTKVSEEQIEKIVTNIEETTKPKIDDVVKIEVVNGDPAVLAPKEEKVTEEKVEKKEEEIKKPKNNMTEKLNKYFNYFWNGQAIDY